MLTGETITGYHLRALRREAERAGDYAQVAICDVALGVAFDARGQIAVSGRTWTQAEARAECARVINEASAQVPKDGQR